MLIVLSALLCYGGFYFVPNSTVTIWPVNKIYNFSSNQIVSCDNSVKVTLIYHLFEGLLISFINKTPFTHRNHGSNKTLTEISQQYMSGSVKK